jgi:polyisoprenoid-binding protein YceI
VADDERSQSLKLCVDPLESSLVAHFDAIELAFDVTHVGLQTIEATVDALEATADIIEATLDRIEASLQTIEASIRLGMAANEKIADLTPDVFWFAARTPRTPLRSHHRLILPRTPWSDVTIDDD